MSQKSRVTAYIVALNKSALLRGQNSMTKLHMVWRANKFEMAIKLFKIAELVTKSMVVKI